MLEWMLCEVRRLPTGLYSMRGPIGQLITITIICKVLVRDKPLRSSGVALLCWLGLAIGEVIPKFGSLLAMGLREPSKLHKTGDGALLLEARGFNYYNN